jgi:hypothetical protein
MIYAIGDSFTAGDELLDPAQTAWPAVLSKKLNRPVTNQGRPAVGNTRIVKRVIDAVINQAEIIIIGWTDCARQEFADDIGIYDIWAGRNYRAFQLDDPTHRINLIKHLTVYDVPKYYYADWLRKVILVQSLCKLHNIPCTMFISCSTNYIHREFHSEFAELLSLIDQSMFIDSMSNSTTEWCYGLPHGPNGHPLDDGHRVIAEKIYEHIRNLGWVS